MTDIVAPPAPLPDWAARAVNLASPRLGTVAHACSDQFFAPMERMLADTPAVFRPGVFDGNGKWMDGWESRRRRDGGRDWCVVRLGVAGIVRGVDIDTSHFTGNYPPAASIYGAFSEEEPDDATEWTPLVLNSELGPDSHHLRECIHSGPVNWLRLEIYPDGGVARLRVYGDPVADWRGQEVVELSALTNGGRVLAYNDAHYGDVWAILAPGRGANMGDGWETRRRREPGHDWLIAKLGAPGIIERIEVDTAHFKGNFPESCSLQAAHLTRDEGVETAAMFWPEVMARQTLSADALHVFDQSAINAPSPVTHIKLNIHPDGGVSRLRIFGRRTDAGE